MSLWTETSFSLTNQIASYPTLYGSKESREGLTGTQSRFTHIIINYIQKPTNLRWLKLAFL